MKIINVILGTAITIVGLTGCNTIKTSHHVIIDHNVNINVNNFNIGLTHKRIDNNGSSRIETQSLTMSDIISNIDSIESNGTN